MKNIIIENSEKSFTVQFLDFKSMNDNDSKYFHFIFRLKSLVFKMSTHTYSSTDELFKFIEDLRSLGEKKTNVIYFAPLGEFWLIKFSWKDANVIVLEGGISDTEDIQSRLEFSAFLSVNDILRTVKQLGSIL